MNDADRRAIELVAFDLLPTDEHMLTLRGCSPLGQAAMLLSGREEAIKAWYQGSPDTTGAMSRIASRAVDEPSVAARIDATLEQDPTVLADLCRAQITWSHPSLEQLLDHEEFRGPAATMLAQSEFAPITRWLDAQRTPEELLTVARAIAPSGIQELFDALSPWFEAVGDAEPSAAAQLEAALFVLSPREWARGFLRGAWDASFLHDPLAMADILTSCGLSYWSGALARFTHHADEFASVARMAAGGAAAMLHFDGEEEVPEELVRAFYTEDWATLAGHPAFAATIALAEEKSWQQPLLESAAHDLMLSQGFESPGIGGLPLSASEPDADEIAAAVEFAGQQDVDPIALVVTICDVLELRDVPEFNELPKAFRHCQQSEHAAVAAAALEFDQVVDLQTERQLATQETMEGIVAAERIARIGTEDSRIALVDLWAEGPVSRVPLYSMLLHQELRTLPLDLMEK